MRLSPKCLFNCELSFSTRRYILVTKMCTRRVIMTENLVSKTIGGTAMSKTVLNAKFYMFLFISGYGVLQFQKRPKFQLLRFSVHFRVWCPVRLPGQYLELSMCLLLLWSSILYLPNWRKAPVPLKFEVENRSMKLVFCYMSRAIYAGYSQSGLGTRKDLPEIFTDGKYASFPFHKLLDTIDTHVK